ncbi:hypothetical protein IV505_14975 [Pseudomonas fulva]|nr:hypothetical protein [Pseudomonas fulva]MBF8781018.1 hypothetical protein [Pseudomonas fulva]
MAGFYTRDNQGRVTFQLTDRIVRLLGAVEITAGNVDGFVDIPSNTGGQPFYFCSFSQAVSGMANNGKRAQRDGWRVNWSGMPIGTIIRYGVY